MGVTTVRTPAEFEERLARYLYERSEEGRAVRVGEKETSEQAEIWTSAIDPVSRNQLLNGWDDVDLTESYREQIAAFKAKDKTLRPWANPTAKQ